MADKMVRNLLLYVDTMLNKNKEHQDLRALFLNPKTDTIWSFAPI